MKKLILIILTAITLVSCGPTEEQKKQAAKEIAQEAVIEFKKEMKAAWTIAEEKAELSKWKSRVKRSLTMVAMHYMDGKQDRLTAQLFLSIVKDSDEFKVFQNKIQFTESSYTGEHKAIFKMEFKEYLIIGFQDGEIETIKRNI